MKAEKVDHLENLGKPSCIDEPETGKRESEVLRHTI